MKAVPAACRVPPTCTSVPNRRCLPPALTQPLRAGLRFQLGFPPGLALPPPGRALPPPLAARWRLGLGGMAAPLASAGRRSARVGRRLAPGGRASSCSQGEPASRCALERRRWPVGSASGPLARAGPCARWPQPVALRGGHRQLPRADPRERPDGHREQPSEVIAGPPPLNQAAAHPAASTAMPVTELGATGRSAAQVSKRSDQVRPAASVQSRSRRLGEQSARRCQKDRRDSLTLAAAG